jgi:hypothetical protein
MKKQHIILFLILLACSNCFGQLNDSIVSEYLITKLQFEQRLKLFETTSPESDECTIIRAQNNKFSDNIFRPKINEITNYIIESKNVELLSLYLRIMLYTTNSVDESYIFSFAKLYINFSDIVLEKINSLNSIELKKYLSDSFYHYIENNQNEDVNMLKALEDKLKN